MLKSSSSKPVFLLFPGTAGGQHIVGRCVLVDGGGGAFSPPLLLQQLDAVVHIKLDGSPVPLVANQQGAQFQAAFTVRFGGDAQLQEVSL